MERDIEQYFVKIKGWLLAGNEIYEPKLVSSKYLKNIAYY